MHHTHTKQRLALPSQFPTPTDTSIMDSTGSSSNSKPRGGRGRGGSSSRSSSNRPPAVAHVGPRGGTFRLVRGADNKTFKKVYVRAPKGSKPSGQATGPLLDAGGPASPADPATTAPSGSA